MFSLRQRNNQRCRLNVERLEDRLVPTALPVLMVLPNQDFFYKDYSDTRVELEAAGLDVDVTAATMSLCRPHANSGQGADGGLVTPELTFAGVAANRYSAIVFVGGWGASAYQYGFSGTYYNSTYNGSSASRATLNQLIGDFMAQDKTVAAVCYGVTVLGWARVDGVSPLAGRSVTGYNGAAPCSTVSAATTTRWHIEANGATMVPSGSIGNPYSVADDVIIDGRLITAEDWRSARAFGRAVANQVQTPTLSIHALASAVDEHGVATPAFSIERAPADNLDSELTVYYSVGGSATPGADFAPLSGTVIIAAGQTSATITLAPVNDAVLEGAESVMLTLEQAAGYTLSQQTSASVAITDDERLPVLMVIANVDFYFQEYNDTRISLEAAGLQVRVAAETVTWCRPHPNSGQGDASGFVMPDLAVVNASAADYSAIAFVGGWGSSSYQYAFEGTYQNAAYRGTTTTKAAVNQLINDFVDQDKYVAGVCHGVTVLAYARVDGASLLEGKTVSAYALSAPNRIDAGVYENTTRWQVESNGANMVASGSVGDPLTAADDVIVDGKIITGENFDSALYFGRVLAEQVLA